MPKDDTVELDYMRAWKEFGDQFDWRLVGWTSDKTGCFLTDAGKQITVTEAERESITVRIDRIWNEALAAAADALVDLGRE